MSRLLSGAIPAAVLFLALGMVRAFAAASLSQQVNPQEANVGDEITLSFTIQNGSASSVDLPAVSGLQTTQTFSSTNITLENGAFSSALTQTFTVVALRAGDFTIPAFEIHLSGGEILKTNPIKLHVVASGAPAPAPSNNASPFPVPNLGPVIMPPPNQPTNPPPDNSETNSTIKAPVDSDGRPARVFMVLTPKTTDAYVGESVPLRIDFYIRADSLAQQDSLPTIKGSDFLMNDLSVRGSEDLVSIENEPYQHQTWLTAISTPRRGDFSLQMVRDTYWVNSNQNPNIFSNPFASFFNRGHLAHANIASNQLTIHARPLPEEGRPAGFSGAIGQFDVAGNASPTTTNVNDPIYVSFTVSGQGNFDSVRCPAMAADPNWKRYSPVSQVHYQDEAHTQGEKNFREDLIPIKNGTLSLPSASFSYFDPAARKYVTLAIPLPSISVTGTPLPPSTLAADAASASNSSAPLPSTPGFASNRLDFGLLRANLTPSYRNPWFWISQAAALAAAVAAGLVFFTLSRRQPDLARIEAKLRERSLQQLEATMSTAAAQNDPVEFFLAARRAVQTRWSAAWRIQPEAVTLSEIARHDPPLAEAATPLFHQADAVMYSGEAPGAFDLADWERHVREDLLQMQPA